MRMHGKDTFHVTVGFEFTGLDFDHCHCNIGAVIGNPFIVGENVIVDKSLCDSAETFLGTFHMMQFHLAAEIIDKLFQRFHMISQLDVIIDESSKMNNMVRKLLTLNQLEFGNDQVTMERFDITQLVKGVISGMKLLIEDKGASVTINTDEPVYVWGDEFKIEEVVTNYMSNALNHLDYDKKIDVRIIRENGLVRVSVFNTGNPIPEGDIDKIWDKFYKVDKARTREYGGSGIGLSIVKAIMESHNQQCGVKNYEDGVQFWFTLEGK